MDFPGVELGQEASRLAMRKYAAVIGVRRRRGAGSNRRKSRPGVLSEVERLGELLRLTVEL